MKKLLVAIMTCLVLFFGGTGFAHADAYPGRQSLFTEKYDRQFEKWCGIYMPTYDWKWLKAQCYQESLFDEKAVSFVGAQGLCQFMPKTWEQMEKGEKVKGSPFNPNVNIQFAASYMNRLLNTWKWKRPPVDRLKLAQASYNAGVGHILKAQNLSEDKTHFQPIIDQLHNVTGKHAKETRTYVIRIQQWFDRLQRGV